MSGIADWLEGNQATCYIKAATGHDCPGCGFQRAFVAFLRGDWGEAWEMYPPLFPFLLTMLLLVAALAFRYRGRLFLLKGAFFTTILFVLVNFAAKFV